MIGVAIPAHNEEGLLDDCLQSVTRAAHHPGLGGETVQIVVVLDSCSDASASIAARHNVTVLRTNARNVGVARMLGARHLLSCEARWLAFTDADSKVPPDWLAVQASLHADAFVGLVAVDDWRPSGGGVSRELFDRGYIRREGHPHVHGANLGIDSRAYVRAGGFSPIAKHEDVTLIHRLVEIGADIRRSARCQVTTSGRVNGKADGGFASFLAGLIKSSDAA